MFLGDAAYLDLFLFQLIEDILDASGAKGGVAGDVKLDVFAHGLDVRRCQRWG